MYPSWDLVEGWQWPLAYCHHWLCATGQACSSLGCDDTDISHMSIHMRGSQNARPPHHPTWILFDRESNGFEVLQVASIKQTQLRIHLLLVPLQKPWGNASIFLHCFYIVPTLTYCWIDRASALMLLNSSMAGICWDMSSRPKHPLALWNWIAVKQFA